MTQVEVQGETTTVEVEPIETSVDVQLVEVESTYLFISPFLVLGEHQEVDPP